MCPTWLRTGFVVARGRAGPWHWHPSRFPPGTASRVLPPGAHRRTVTLTSRWKSREYGNTGASPRWTRRWRRRRWWWFCLPDWFVAPVKRLSLSSSFRSAISPPDVAVFSAGRPFARVWRRYPDEFFLLNPHVCVCVPEDEGKSEMRASNAQQEYLIDSKLKLYFKLQKVYLFG